MASSKSDWWASIPITEEKISRKVADQFGADGYTLMPPFPKAVLVELANVCNHACVFCAISKSTRAPHHVSRELLERVLKEALVLGATEVGLYSGAEPFASKQLDYFVGFCKEVGFEHVYTTTNGAIPTTTRLARVIDSGLSSIKFSVNGGTRQAYKTVHGKDDFERVIGNIKFVDGYRKERQLDLYLAATFVECDENRGTFPELQKLLTPYVDELLWLQAVNQNGQTYGLPKGPFTTPCFYPFKEVHITQEGYLRACCNDYQNYLATDDLGEMSLEAAFYSHRMELLRGQHLDGELGDTLCHNCVHNRLDPIQPLNDKLATKVPLEFFRASPRPEKIGRSSRPGKSSPVEQGTNLP